MLLLLFLIMCRYRCWGGRNLRSQVFTNSSALQRGKASTNYVVETFNYAVAYVHPEVAGKSVGEYHAQLVIWYWPGHDESMLWIVTSVIHTTIFSFMTSVIADLPDPSWTVRQHWSCLEKPHWDVGHKDLDVNRTCDDNPAVEWVHAVMNLNNPTHVGKLCCSQQANGTSYMQTPLCGCHRYSQLDDILPLPAADMTNNDGEVSNDDADTWRPNTGSYL